MNDVLQSVVRPASGGMVFAAGAASDTVAVQDPAVFVSSGQIWPFVLGIGIALIPHILKAVARPVLNVLTAGAGAAVASFFEGSWRSGTHAPRRGRARTRPRPARGHRGLARAPPAPRSPRACRTPHAHPKGEFLGLRVREAPETHPWVGRTCPRTRTETPQARPPKR